MHMFSIIMHIARLSCIFLKKIMHITKNMMHIFRIIIMHLSYISFLYPRLSCIFPRYHSFIQDLLSCIFLEFIHISKIIMHISRQCLRVQAGGLAGSGFCCWKGKSYQCNNIVILYFKYCVRYHWFSSHVQHFYSHEITFFLIEDINFCETNYTLRK